MFTCKPSLTQVSVFIMMFVNNTSSNSLRSDGFQGQNDENGTCLLQIDLVAVIVSYTTINSVLLVASLVGNSLLIYESLKWNVIIANIAVSDLLFSIIHFPREIVAEIKGSTAFVVQGWIGEILCKICAFVTDVTIAVSTLSLLVIAADRLAAVVFPLKHHGINVKTRRLLIVFTWIVAMAIHSPYFYTFRLEMNNGETFCRTNWEPAFDHNSTHKRYYTVLLVTVLIVPLVAVTIIQTITLVKLRSDHMAPFRSSRANLRLTKRNKKLLKMSVVIILAFSLCWLPFIAFQFLFLYFPKSIPRCSLIFEISFQFVTLFSLCHCTVNPCICFFFMRSFRIFIKRAVYTISQRKSSSLVEERL